MKYPFTTEQFFGAFADYNASVWPAQILLYIAALSIAVLIFRKTRTSNKVISLILAGYWLWMGVAYHWIFFAPINPAAKLFGALFIAEGLLIAYAGLRGKLDFSFQRGPRGYLGLALMVFGTLVYPAIGHLLGHTYPFAPTFGLPCPTTIFTIGVLLLAARPPRHIVIIPFLWSVIGFFAAISFGVKEDVALLVAGVIGLVLICLRRPR